MQHAEVSIPIEVGGAELDDPGVVTDAAVLGIDDLQTSPARVVVEVD